MCIEKENFTKAMESKHVNENESHLKVCAMHLNIVERFQIDLLHGICSTQSRITVHTISIMIFTQQKSERSTQLHFSLNGQPISLSVICVDSAFPVCNASIMFYSIIRRPRTVANITFQLYVCSDFINKYNYELSNSFPFYEHC